MNKQILLGQTSLILLESLFNGNKYGKELLSYIQPHFQIKQSTLYATLSRLEKQGLISSYWQDSPIGGKRHYYSLTEFGKKTFEEQKNSILPQNTEKKYDEIGGFQKTDDELITNLNSSHILGIKNVAVQANNHENFLEPYYIPEEKYDEIDNFENMVDNSLTTNKDEFFTNNKLAENTFSNDKNITSNLNFELQNTQNEKVIYTNEKYQNLKKDFNSNTNKTENNFEIFAKIPSNNLFAKYFTIFLLIIFESAVIWCWSYFTKGTVQYSFAYIILPIIFAIIAFSILFSKKKFYKLDKQNGNHFGIYVLIFIAGFALLYSLNLFLGITPTTILEFETTFIYPTVMLTNVLIAGIFDTHLARKYT